MHTVAGRALGCRALPVPVGAVDASLPQRHRVFVARLARSGLCPGSGGVRERPKIRVTLHA